LISEVAVRVPGPDRCGDAEARILLGLAEHFFLYCLRGAELPQDANEETLLVD
jgi:hypothetical protein